LFFFDGYVYVTYDITTIITCCDAPFKFRFIIQRSDAVYPVILSLSKPACLQTGIVERPLTCTF
jgi:hypothetical protein